jgi:endo-1,4-beta-mannosidase
MAEERFSIGINYWPGETAMYWWRMFSSAQVKRDFSVLAEYRFDVARINLLWEDFQPEIGMVSVRALDHLVQVANIAHDHRLQILPTFFCGHLSGFNWVPSWLVESGKTKGDFPVCTEGKIIKNRLRNMFTDRDVRKAQKLFVHETASALQGHPAIWGWDLGNQITRFAIPPSQDHTRAWFEEMLNELRRRDAHLPVTTAIHQGDLERPGLMGPKEAAGYCDFLSVHAGPPFPQWADGSGDSLFPVFQCLMTKWLGGKKVILESLGIPTKPPAGALNESDRERLESTRLFSEGDAESYVHKVLNLLGQNGVSGAFARGFADFDSNLWEKPPFDERIQERFYGLFHGNGAAKQSAHIFSEFPRGQQEKEPDWAWIDIDLKEYYENPLVSLKHLYGRFRDWRPQDE